VVFLPSLLGRRTSASLLAVGLGALPLGSLGADLLLSRPAAAQSAKQPVELLLVSYAVTKAAYDQIIPLFAADWKKKTGQTVTIKASYGGGAYPRHGR